MAIITMFAKLRAETEHKAKWVVASCPDLDVHSQGTTEEEAKKNLAEAISLFFISCFERGTLEAVLKECGFRPHLLHEPMQQQKDEPNMIDVPIPLFLDKAEDAFGCPA